MDGKLEDARAAADGRRRACERIAEKPLRPRAGDDQGRPDARGRTTIFTRRRGGALVGRGALGKIHGQRRVRGMERGAGAWFGGLLRAGFRGEGFTGDEGVEGVRGQLIGLTRQWIDPSNKNSFCYRW